MGGDGGGGEVYSKRGRSSSLVTSPINDESKPFASQGTGPERAWRMSRPSVQSRVSILITISGT